MNRSLSASRVASLLGSAAAHTPAYRGIADGLRLLVADGRVLPGTRLPSERDLTVALRVSRTTVSRAYDLLREQGYLESRRGSGSVTRLPRTRGAVEDHLLRPDDGRPDTIDLTTAASSAPPGVAAAYERAVAELPPYLAGSGHFPTGLPVLRELLAGWYGARGLATRPEQIVVTAGALAGLALAARAFTGTGDRVLVESPTYPNAIAALRRSGTRVLGTPVGPTGWDTEALEATLRQSAPRLAYLVPDFQNPTGALMDDSTRARVGAALRGSRTLTVVDESLVDVELEPVTRPRPMAVHVPDAVTLGSAGKAFWGGLRIGWLRAPEDRTAALVSARLTLDLGAPVLEQLVLAQLLREGDDVLAHQRARLRERRDHLTAALARTLPAWELHPPQGGLALWCRLPAPLSTALTVAAERRGVLLAAGSSFAPDGGLERFLRLPFNRPPEQLDEAVERIASAWHEARQHRGAAGPRPPLVA